VTASAHPVLLYDGVCGLCNWLVRFVVRHDRKEIFRYASLQSDTAVRVLQRQKARPRLPDTFYVVLEFQQASERLLDQSDAAIYVLQQLGGGWRCLAAAGQLLPRPFRNWLYGLVARHRYRIFGKHESCPLPDPKVRSRFLDL
jgi:predicted DCC family thiol-disulfide oxidoreductase YuxK